ncbi:uncharacterized mitochondrial protein-like protein [Tanacetum coccineum]
MKTALSHEGREKKAKNCKKIGIQWGNPKLEVFKARRGPLKDGFKAGKKDLLGLDGCFLSGSYPGWILTAVGVDPNNGIYPLAYAIVESENKDSWKWFLECVGDDLDLFRNSNFTFISDWQKGIIPAIAESFPSAEHRFCLKHIYDNMKPSWRGRAHCDVLLNNMCEKVISKSDGPLTPNATKVFNKIMKEAGQMKQALPAMRTRTGYLLLFGGAPISWKTKKQNVVSRSSAEAEYRSMASTVSEILWMWWLLKELNINLNEPTPLFCENQAARHIANNLVFHERTKHVEIDCYFVQERVESQDIQPLRIHTSMQIAYLLTKGLGIQQLKFLLDKLGIRNLHALT